MILGIGVDIIEIKRIKKLINKYGNRFKNKCFHKNEILRSENKLNSVESYAKRYAAKEACAKALGTGLARGVHWKDIEIYNNKYGKPHILLHNKAKKYLPDSDNKKHYIEVSLTDEKELAVANVIIHRWSLKKN